MQNSTEITCPICGGHAYSTITEKYVSPFQNKLFLTRKEAIDIKKVPLSMVICHSCGLVFNHIFDSNIERYDAEYCNEQAASISFKKHIREFTNYLYQSYLQPQSVILEIGCGFDGAYLKDFIMDAPVPCNGIGYDPAYTGNHKIEIMNAEGTRCNIQYHTEYFTKESQIPQNPHLVIARHLIEHLPDPTILLQNFVSINSSPVFCIETPDVTWIFENEAWYDFFDEHCTLFSPVSITFLMSLFGLEIIEIRQAFGNQYMQIFAQKSTKVKHSPESFSSAVKELLQKVQLYVDLESKRFSECEKLIATASSKGTCVVWGGGAKANSFLNMFDPERKKIKFVVDINSQKCGKFIAGTGHEICPPVEIAQQNISSVIIMNSNYREEIQKTIDELNIKDIELFQI